MGVCREGEFGLGDVFEDVFVEVFDGEGSGEGLRFENPVMGCIDYVIGETSLHQTFRTYLNSHQCAIRDDHHVEISISDQHTVGSLDHLRQDLLDRVGGGVALGLGTG